jgi:hypothetical protein
VGTQLVTSRVVLSSLELDKGFDMCYLLQYNLSNLEASVLRSKVYCFLVTYIYIHVKARHSPALNNMQ